MKKPYYKKSHQAWYLNQGGKSIRLGKTEEEAQAAYNRLCLPCSNVGDLIDRFLDYHRKVSAPGTVTFYEGPLKSFLDSLTCRAIAEIRPYHVTAWLHGDGTYRHNQARAVKACFAWGVKEGLISASPLQHMRLPAAKSRGDEAYLRPEQVSSVLAATEGPLNDLLLFLRHTGCRPMEARIAAASHLQGRCLVFSKVESKGKADCRVIVLDDVAFGICQRLALKHPTGPLFRNAHGNPWTAKLLDRRCAAISKRVGCKFTPYSLRHTYATDAIVRGVDLQTVATLLGHTDLKMLSKVYQHIQRQSDHLQASVQRITA
jgi:integrase